MAYQNYTELLYACITFVNPAYKKYLPHMINNLKLNACKYAKTNYAIWDNCTKSDLEKKKRLEWNFTFWVYLVSENCLHGEYLDSRSYLIPAYFNHYTHLS